MWFVGACFRRCGFGGYATWFDFVCGLPMDFGWFGQIAAERQVGGVAMWCCIWFVVFIVAILWFCAMWLLIVGFGVVGLCVGV